MKYSPINIKEKFTQFSDRWAPKIIAQLNDYHFKLVKLQGDFVWHQHDHTDEAFMVIDGELTIRFRDDKVVLGPGEMYVVPKGVEHKTWSREECHIILIEPAGTLNTGDVMGELTAKDEGWV